MSRSAEQIGMLDLNFDRFDCLSFSFCHHQNGLYMLEVVATCSKSPYVFSVSISMCKYPNKIRLSYFDRFDRRISVSLLGLGKHERKGWYKNVEITWKTQGTFLKNLFYQGRVEEVISMQWSYQILSVPLGSQRD